MRSTCLIVEASAKQLMRLSFRVAVPLGVSFPTLQPLAVKGRVMKVGSRLDRLSEVRPSELEIIAMVASEVPAGTISLLSALRVHGIGTRARHEVWFADDRKVHRAMGLRTLVCIVRLSGPMLPYGVKTQEIVGVPARLTSLAHTVLNCFRYRNKLGLDLATEALRGILRSRLVSVDELVRTAEVCR